jgi:tetratricopeptide (TPR) repeat protein
LWQKLVEQEPAVFQPELAAALHNLSSCHVKREEFIEAHSRALEAAMILDELVKANPALYLSQLAITLANLGRVCGRLGKKIEALACHRRSLKIRRQLVDERPDLFLPHLASALTDLAGSEVALDQNDAALHSISEAVAVFKDLATRFPERNILHQQRAQAYLELIPLLERLGKTEQARALLENDPVFGNMRDNQSARSGA